MLLLVKFDQSNEMLSTGFFFLHIFVNFYCLVFGKVVGKTGGKKSIDLPYISFQDQH